MPSLREMWLYRALFAIDALTALALGYIYLDGLAYSDPVESLMLVGPVLAVLIIALVGAALLRKHGKLWLACALLALPALPALIAAGFFGLLVAFPPNYQ